MNLNHSISVFILLFCSNFIAQNNLIIFSENSELFQVEYQQKIIPPVPQTDIKLTQITDNPAHIKIIFKDPSLKPIDTTIYLFHPSKPLQNQDVIYLIQKNNRTLRYLATLPSSDLKPAIPEIDTSIVVKTKEEKNIQKIIFFNDSTASCLNPADTADFSKAMKYIQQNPNADRKIVLMEQFIRHNCFNKLQAQAVIEQIPFEVERLKIMKQILSRLTNVFNCIDFKNFLKYPTAQESFTQYYTGYLLNLHNFPLLTDSLLNAALQLASKINDEHARIQHIQVILSHYSIQFNHLEKILNLFYHDQSKEDVLKCAYYSLKNKSDFLKSLKFLQFNETQNRIKNFYEQQQSH